MNMRIGTQTVDYKKVAEALNEINVAPEQILEMPSALKPAVTSINAKIPETKIPSNEYLKHKGTDFATVRREFAASIYTGGLSKTAGSINTDGLNSAVPLFVKGRGDANSVAMNDINQGQTGDCWMMASLAALASKDPEAIKRMIQDNGDGTYTVTFKQKVFPFETYVDKKVTVAGVFPNSLSQPGDKNGKGVGEIWPQVIEKAYAKLKGGYDKIEGGSPAEFLEAITGRPATKHIPMLFDYSFETLENDFNSGKNIVFGTFDTISGKYGLVPDHAYALNRVYTDPTTGRQMVELYNPWGNTHPQAIPYDEIFQHIERVTVN
jgi:hypothetical protein